MTITAQTSKTGPYNGNGTTTVFSYTFEVQDETHLVVTLADASGVETVQVLNTDYTVSGVGNANGGQITMSTAPASGYTLTISRNIPITQEVDLENRRSVAPEVLEDAYDKLTQIAQDLSEQVGRAIKVSVTEGGNPTLSLQGDVQPNTFLGFDASGNLAQLEPASGTFISPNAALVQVDDFTGDGTTVDFTLGGIPLSPNNLFIFLDGVMQDAANYTVSGTTLTFTTAPPLNTNIEVRRLQAVSVSGGTTADLVTYSPAGSGAVIRTVQSRLRDFVSVKDFGAVGDGVTDDTAAMQAAHDTGKMVFYPVGVYLFSSITITSGGIWGEGKETILKTTDTSTGNVIEYGGIDPTGLLINTNGGLFKDFTLTAATAAQKSAGAGIAVIQNFASPPNAENYLTICDGLYVRNIPTGLSFELASFFSVTNCYFAFCSIAGIYTDMDSVTFQDNGDNHIIGNYFFTNAATSPSGRGIWYRSGGARIIGNKVNGGQIGIDINPLRGTSIAIVEGNSVENQTGGAIRGYIGSDFVAAGASDGFSFLQFIGNQIGGYNLTGPAISVDSYASDPKFYSCTISDNLIYNPQNYNARAIDIRQVDRFLVSNNFVDNSAAGYGSLFVASTATSGLVTRNQFLRASTNNILNSSTTATLDEIIAEYSATYDPPSINAGATLTLAVTVNGASFGDYVMASFSSDLGGITLTAYVSAANTVTFAFFNGTVSPIDLAPGTIRARVISA